MKFIVLILAILAVGACAGDDLASKETQEKCLKANGISAETFKSEMEKDTASKATKCTLACIYNEYLNEDGSVNMDKIAPKLEGNQKVADAIKECSASAPKADKCEAIFEITKCVRKKDLRPGGQ